MSRPANSHDAMTPKNSGVEFARSADDFPVARIGDITLAMLSLVDGGGFLASAWCVSRPLAEMTRADFFGHEGRLDDEAAFRDRVFETADAADIGPGEWQGFVCVEAANAYADAITLLPGEHWTISQRIEVQPRD